jgi:centromere protein I
MLDSAVSSRIELLNFYSALITEWGVKLRTQPSVSEESFPSSRIIEHAELLASSLQELVPTPATSDKNGTPIVLSVLQFYKSLAALFSHAAGNANIRLTVPIAPTIYSIAFTPTVSVISELNSILASYKSSFEASLASDVIKPPDASEPLYRTELVNQFNGYVMDMCNLVWRNRALNTEDPNAQGCLMPAPSTAALTAYVRNVNEAARHYDRESAFHTSLASIFSLSHHAAFANLSAACFAEIEEDQNIADDRPKLRKPATQKALQALEKDGGAKITWQEYRVHMLDWLEAVGSRGTSDLMRSTMKALRKE